MALPTRFIRAAAEYNTFEKHVPAPYFRKAFTLPAETAVHITISACGFYELYLNGKNVTKGALAPYISNPDDLVYYDEYDLALPAGENVIGVLLGNGFQNNPGGYIWSFDQAPFRGAPQFALRLTCRGESGEEISIESDERFLTAPSPITFDDYRFGEHYNANLELPGWNLPGFDDSSWLPAQPAPTPRGEKRLCEAEPIVVTEELKPVSIFPMEDGYCYDFGLNGAGVCRLTVTGRPGQQINLVHAEHIKEDGSLDMEGVWFHREEHLWQRDLPLLHRDIYTCRGGGEESFTPRFTYHGFRYVLVTGVTEEQATADLLTYVVMNSALEERGSFSCSDETVNALQQITRRSDLSNFYYFPTDCPQREKNGWTADAALSAEHMLMNLSVEKSFIEWQRSIVKSQFEGHIPGYVPDSTRQRWNYGPAWDAVLAEIPYQTYVYRGDTQIIRESAAAFMAYLHLLTTLTTEDGLLNNGLGDWCPVARRYNDYLAPLEVTSTIMGMDIARKMSFLFDVIDMPLQRDFAQSIADRFRAAIRTHLVDFAAMTVAGNCQTSQAMALYYGVFEPGEQAAAFSRLLEFVHQKNDLMDVGVLGGRVLFHVLARFGHAGLALRMIARPEFPSYGNWLSFGATTLFESAGRPNRTSSRNHHFWGDISGWFIQYLAGIRLNPTGRDVNRVHIAPCFVSSLTHAEGYHDAPAGRIYTAWERQGDEIILTVDVPEGMTGQIILEPGYAFSDLHRILPLRPGEYTVVRL